MSMRIPELRSKRLVIREFAATDLARVSQVLDACFGPASQEIRSFWLRWTIDSYRALGHMQQPPYADRAVCLPDGQLVGCVGVVPSYGPFALIDDPERGADAPHQPEVGLFWAMAPEYRGRGLATEAARALITWLREDMKLARVVATTEFENDPSIAVMHRLGMRVWRNPSPSAEWFQVVGMLDLQR